MSSYHCKFDFPGHRIVPCADCQQPKCQTCDIFHWSFFCNRKICINCAVQPKYQSDVHTIQELQALQQEELLVEEPRGFFEEAKQGDQAVPGSRENPHVFEEEEPKEEEEEEEELKEEPEPPDTCCICMEEYSESENRNRYIFPVPIRSAQAALKEADLIGVLCVGLPYQRPHDLWIHPRPHDRCLHPRRRLPVVDL